MIKEQRIVEGDKVLIDWTTSDLTVMLNVIRRWAICCGAINIETREVKPISRKKFFKDNPIYILTIIDNCCMYPECKFYYFDKKEAGKHESYYKLSDELFGTSYSPHIDILEIEKEKKC